MRRFKAILTALVAAAALAGVPAAAGDGGGANHVVLAQTSLDGAFQPRSGVQIVGVAGDSVQSTNLARATATDCNGCHASAVAVQVLLVTGNPSDFEPANGGFAVNGNCTGCGTFAYAWQYWLQTNGPVYLSADAQEKIAELRQEIADTTASTVPADVATDDELKARLDSLTSQLESVVNSDVQAAGQQPAGTVVEHVDSQQGS